jgi:hypothetical protein
VTNPFDLLWCNWLGSHVWWHILVISYVTNRIEFGRLEAISTSFNGHFHKHQRAGTNGLLRSWHEIWVLQIMKQLRNPPCAWFHSTFQIGARAGIGYVVLPENRFATTCRRYLILSGLISICNSCNWCERMTQDVASNISHTLVGDCWYKGDIPWF